MCQYIKDDGEQCGRSAEPFCHDHEDSDQAAEYSQSVSDDAQSISPSDWTPTTCDVCGSAVRVVCARLDEAAFQPTGVVPTFALTCACGDSVHWDPDWASIPKSETPAKWLFEPDRDGAWDAENEEIVSR